ncbi:hypothetical protein Tco_0664505 [Tanacetum coccineum]
MKDQVQDSSQINLPSHLRVRTGFKTGQKEENSILPLDLEDQSLLGCSDSFTIRVSRNIALPLVSSYGRDESRTFSSLPYGFTA